MKNAVTLLVLIILSIGVGSTIIGCKTKKELITFFDSNAFFRIVGYSKQAPFSPDPNLYGYLEVKPKKFVSNQIVNILVFQDVRGELCVIYKTTDGEHILLCSKQVEERRVISSPEELFYLANEIEDFKNLELNILSHKIILDDSECVLLNWRSGGINIYSFKQFREGLISSFSYKNLDKADPFNSGKVVFTEWDKNDDNWPEIKEFRRPREN
jgi:hypothetical protein